MLKHTLSGLLFCALSGALVAHAQQFLEAPQYPTGTNPQAVAVGDFNGDGKLDLAVVNTASNTISVLLGKGDGTFNPKVDYATGNGPQRVAVGDFNGDGHLDLAVTNSGSNTVSVLLGNGDGTFQAKLDSATGSGPQGLAVGDFNGDGHLDIVVTNNLASNVGVLLGNGKGTFGAQVTYTTPSGPYAVAVGDFNNDGIQDFAVANKNTNTSLVSVFLGNGTAGVGNGTFQTQLQYAIPAGDAPVAIALKDFNGDGNLDIAIAEEGTPGNTVSILLGNGKGSFATHVEYSTGAFPTSLTVGDFNEDGKWDLAVTVGNGNAITVLWGMGDGTFQGQVNLGTGDIPYSVATGDFNGDGKTDMVAANSGGNTVSVILNNGDYTFQARTDYPVNPSPYSVVTADFNGDGHADIAVANSDCQVFPACGPGTISIILGNGDGTFQAPNHYSTGTDTDPYSLVVGDFNGDKIPDLAVANYATNTVSVMLGVGDGSFLGHTDFPVGSEPDSVATGDFNGDGDLDLAVANFNSNTVSVLLSNGDGTFKSAVSYNVGHGPISVVAADFNGDHKQDLVVVNETDNNASILLGNGDGTFKTQVAYPTVGGNPLSVVVGDFNGDGIPDLAVADYQSQEVSVLLGNGDGTFQPVKVYPTGANPSSIVIADFNGDGKLDLALTSTPLGSSPGNLVSLLLGNGDGTFRAPTLFGAGYLSYSAAVGDFNGDGAQDLAVANGASNTVSVLLNTQGTAMTFSSSGSPSTFGRSVTFTTTVAVSVSNGTAAPTGSVTLKNGGAVIGSGTLVNGQFSLSTSALPVGTDAISAIYSGDSNYQPHTVGLSQTVQMAGSSTVLISSANPSNPNQSVTFTATVTSSTTGVPTGTVTFLDGTNPIGSSAVNGSGIAKVSVSNLTIGTHNVSAAYAGDSNFNPSTSPVLNQAVLGNTSTALSSSANPSGMSQSVTFTATVSSGTGPTPTGSVKFMDGTTSLGTSTLNASGIATLSIATLSVGTHSVTAVYGGDTNSDPSTSPVLNQVVTAPDFSLSAGALAPSSITPGKSAQSTITISPQGGLDPTTVALKCAVTPAVTPAATCSVGTITVANTVGNATLTFTAAGPQAALATPDGKQGRGSLFALGLIIPAMLLGGAGLNKPGRRKLLGFCLVFLVLSGCFLQVACGGGGSNTPPPTGNSGTPAGTYTVTVTGTANGTQHTAAPVSVTVQ